MQNYCKTIGALAAASALVAGNAKAEVEYELHTGYSSEYLFRGLDRGDNLVELGLDAAYKVDKFTMSGGVWAGAFNNSPARTGNDVDNEVDFYTEGAYDFGFMTASVGYIYYWNVGSLGADNQEVYFALSHDFGFATASLTYYWGVDGGNKGATEGYTELALNKAFELNQCLTLNVGTNVGYLADDGEFTSWTTKASLDWGFTEHAKISPFVALAIGLGEQNNTIWASTRNEIVGGSMLSVNF